MIEFTMPALGADMDEGTLNEWLVKPGDTVTRGQIVAVVETTKAAVEIECWHEGVVGELLVPVGETVAVGTPLATLLEAGEKRRAAPSGVRPGDRGAEAGKPQPTHPQPRLRPRRRRRSGTGCGCLPWPGEPPLSLGVDLKAVTGTGPQGAITLHDVEHAAATAHHEAAQARAGAPTGGLGARRSRPPRRPASAGRRCARRSPRR